MLGYRLAEKSGVEALWRREEKCPRIEFKRPWNLISITFVVPWVEKLVAKAGRHLVGGGGGGGENGEMNKPGKPWFLTKVN
jgi:hypothetical protein